MNHLSLLSASSGLFAQKNQTQWIIRTSNPGFILGYFKLVAVLEPSNSPRFTSCTNQPYPGGFLLYTSAIPGPHPEPYHRY
jgi:hypothetical protein